MIEAVAQAIEDARDGLDLWHAFILGLPALAGVVATLVVTLNGQKKAKKAWTNQDRKADLTLDEVKNDHPENLRDEISRGFKEIRQDIRTLRDELHTERKERIEGDRRDG